MLDADEVEQREFSSILDVNQQVEVALGAMVAAGARAIHGEMRHAIQRKLLAQCAETGRERCPLHLYSAASFAP